MVCAGEGSAMMLDIGSVVSWRGRQTRKTCEGPRADQGRRRRTEGAGAVQAGGSGRRAAAVKEQDGRRVRGEAEGSYEMRGEENLGSWAPTDGGRERTK